MRDYYIFKSGRIKRQDNSVMFEYSEDNQEKHIPIPVNDIDAVYLFGEIDLNTKLLNFLSQHHIMLHFFNYYGYYVGTYYPREFLNSGDMLVRQAAHYTNRHKRLAIAKEFVKGASYGIIQNLKRYKEKTESVIEQIKAYDAQIDEQKKIAGLMGIEGNIRETYYQAFPLIINQEIEFKKRVKNPPDNMMNALISFVNSLIYTEVLKEIYKTQLNPTISFLHEPGDRRFSLALDIAEIFKPIFGDRIMFALLNNGELTKHHFDKDLNYAYLKEDGRKLVVKALDEKLKTTIIHKQLEKKVSYRRLIRLELHKLAKHFLEEKEYTSFRIWW